MTAHIVRRKPTVVAAVLYTAVVSVIFASIAVGLQTAGSPFTLPGDQQFTNTGRQLVASSPDGRQFVYVANNRLYRKTTDTAQPTAIPGTEIPQGLTNPVFSPDGRSIAFWSGADQTFKRIPTEGGAAVTICQAGNPFGMSWGPGDQIVFGQLSQNSRGIMRVSANGGAPEIVATVQSNEVAHGPQLLPDGNSILFTLATIPTGPVSTAELWDKAKIVVQSLKSGERKTLVDGGSDGRYVPTGHIVYANGEKLWAAPLDIQRLELTGIPVAVVEGVARAGATATAQFSFSGTGSLVYLPPVASQVRLAYVDMKGAQKTIGLIPSSTFAPRLSPDGKQAALDIIEGNGAVWIYDLSTTSMRKLPGEGDNRFPLWSGDGQRILFISNRDGPQAMYWQRADATGATERLTETARAPEFWSAPNRLLSFITLKTDEGGADYDVWTYSFETKKATPLITIPKSAQHSSRFSPDGHWVAYVSDETGRLEIFVQPFPITGAKFQITKNGGGHPLWSADGKQIFYDNNGRMFSLRIETQPAFKAGDPAPLPISGFIQTPGNNRRQYDITPDGTKFLMKFPPAQQIQIVPNWFEELKRVSR